jgi:hypothetical protein
MYPVVPSDALTGGWETICFAITLISALVSYLLTWR